MPSLATRNLLHDRVRFVVTLTGIVFSVVLSSIQLGLFVGFTRATSDLIRHAGADVWVMSRGIGNLENAVPFPEQRLYQVQTVPGVTHVQKHIVAVRRTGSSPTAPRKAAWSSASTPAGRWASRGTSSKGPCARSRPPTP